MKSKKNLSALLALVLLCVLTACSPPASDQARNDRMDAHPQAFADVPQPVPRQIAQPQPFESFFGFEVHYLDVGQADASLIVCEDQAMLIDAGNAADSSLIYTYLKDHGIEHLNYIISTHPHEDHVGGLAGALNYASVDVAYSPVTEYDSRAFSSFVKYLDAQDVTITVPSPGDTFTLGSATAQIIGPIIASDDPNNMSIVCRIEYGDTSFLFTGDAEREEELEILETSYALESTVLKVGHHGSSSSTTYPFLRAVHPVYAVISVGADNTYGHPTDATLSKLRDADVTVYRTDLQGTIICRSDEKTVTFSTEKQGNGNQNPAQSSTGTSDGSEHSLSNSYVLNVRSHKFHLPACASVGQMSEKNKEVFSGTRAEVIAKGYEPCGVCQP